MNSLFSLIKKYPLIWGAYILLALFYLLQSVFASVDRASTAQYHISVLNVRLLGLAIGIPYVIIWMIALTGCLRLKSYADAIKNEKDGQAFLRIAYGLFLLVIWLPIQAILGIIANVIYRFHPQYSALITRAENYVELIILFLGFYLVYVGSQKLLSFISRLQLTANLSIVLLYIAFSVIYTFLVFHDPARTVPTGSVKHATYYLHDWLIAVTIVIPRLVYWFLGIQAAYNIYLFEKKVKGRIYKDGLHTLAIGILGIIFSTVLLRCLQSVTTTLVKFSLEWLLILIYILLIVMCVAYVYLAKGSRKLQKLEEI